MQRVTAYGAEGVTCDSAVTTRVRDSRTRELRPLAHESYAWLHTMTALPVPHLHRGWAHPPEHRHALALGIPQSACVQAEEVAVARVNGSLLACDACARGAVHSSPQVTRGAVRHAAAATASCDERGRTGGCSCTSERR
jgi:hypothetical protein